MWNTIVGTKSSQCSVALISGCYETPGMHTTHSNADDTSTPTQNHASPKSLHLTSVCLSSLSCDPQPQALSTMKFSCIHLEVRWWSRFTVREASRQRPRGSWNILLSVNQRMCEEGERETSSRLRTDLFLEFRPQDWVCVFVCVRVCVSHILNQHVWLVWWEYLGKFPHRVKRSGSGEVEREEGQYRNPQMCIS